MLQQQQQQEQFVWDSFSLSFLNAFLNLVRHCHMHQIYGVRNPLRPIYFKPIANATKYGWTDLNEW